MNLMKCIRALILGIIGVVTGLSVQGDVLIDFETPQYPALFKTYISTPTSGSIAQSANGAGNDYLTTTSTSGSILYAADGTNLTAFSVTQASPLTISFKASFNTYNNSIGVYLVDLSSPSSGYLALFNINNTPTGSTDTIRFSTTANPTAAGTVGTLNAGSYANNADVGYTTNSALNTFTFTYSIDADSHPVFSLTAGSVTSSYTDTTLTALTNVGIGFRLSAPGTANVLNLDDIAISQVPEPVTFTMLLGSAGLLFAFRRRNVVSRL